MARLIHNSNQNINIEKIKNPRREKSISLPEWIISSHRYLLGIFILIFSHSVSYAAVDTSQAVIHHTASPCWTTVEDIDRWHKERGWDGIGYHKVILCNGEIKEGRSIHKQGAHAKGRNNKLGIALVGYDLFTSQQIEALKRILSQYSVNSIEQHHKDCPGKGINLEKFLKLED